MTIKLIAIDMDGTLLQPDRSVSPAVKQALATASQQGIQIVLTTGRPYSGVKNYLLALDLQKPTDYCITLNGALLLQAANGEPLAQTPMHYTDYRQLELLARQLNCHFHVMDRHCLYTANRNISRYTVHESSITDIPLIFCEAENMPPQAALLKMMMIDEPEIVDSAQQRLPAELYQRYTVLRSSAYFIEFMAKSVSKGSTLRTLAEKLAIAPPQVMAIGDQQNDIAMLQYAGIAVAMGNALDEVKVQADYITKSNTEDGVAYAIEQWALR